MKKHIISAVALLLTIGSFSSCIDLEELNKDPNNATTAKPELLLTGIAYNAFNVSTYTEAYAIKQLVQTDGESSAQVYKWNRGDFDMYDYMRDITKLQEEAPDNDAYQALVKFFRANYFYQLTLHFGDIPYSEALKGESDATYQPSYDPQEDVFEGILNELAEADKLLSNNTTATISGDIIYDGDLTKWRRLINAYRLRVLMTLSKKSNAGSVDIKQEFAKVVNEGVLMESSDDNGQLTYLDQAGNRYPYFNDSSFGSGMYMDSTYIAALATRKDPRLFAIATRTPKAEKEGKAMNDFTAYDGGDPAVPYSQVNDKATDKAGGRCSKPADRYTKNPVNEPMILLGFTEQELLLAEGIVRGWITGNDKEHYEQAVRASFAFYKEHSTDAAPYLSDSDATKYLNGENVSYSSTLTAEQKIERIIMQKYLPSFLQGQLWLPYYEALRTGYPEFRRAIGTELPYRWMYPQSEYNNNAANVQTALDRQFGGQDKTTDKTWWIK